MIGGLCQLPYRVGEEEPGELGGGEGGGREDRGQVMTCTMKTRGY